MATTRRLLDSGMLERLGVALLLLAAFVPRARDFWGSFDREFEGFQGSCFASFVVNYERLGPRAQGGYPAFNIDLPPDSSPEQLYIYANHPPTVPLLCWASVTLFGPSGWEDAWREDSAPEGIEPALRLPFLISHMLGLLAFWWAVRQAGGARLAMLALAMLAMTPVSILYAQLINYENPSFPLVFLGYGFHARYLRGRAGPNLALTALAFAAATAVTFAPLFFVPALLAQTAWRRGWRTGLRQALAVGLVSLVPILAHGLWVRTTLPPSASGAVLERFHDLLAPLFRGEEPLLEWLRRQITRASYFITWPLLGAALAGLALSAGRLWRQRSRGRATEEPVDLGPVLFAGGALYLFAFYTHTFDGEGIFDGQTIFLINLAPGLALLAASMLDALARVLTGPRGGLIPLVVVTGLIGLPGLSRANEVRARWREPGPLDDPAALDGPMAPLPVTAGRELGALLPAGSVGFYPLALGFSSAQGYYAWRTLIGVDRETFGMRVGSLALFGLEDRPKYLIVPKVPGPAVARQLAEVREGLSELGAPVAQDENWAIWALED